jgi:crotonobetainyl-CoA:carnitine CoA-transferase CaiB-like acyl-CoA transferase
MTAEERVAAAVEAPPSPYPAPDAHRGPLQGVRCIVLTQAWAGTFCTELLGLMGAEVIQVEARQRLDSWRGGSYRAQVPPGLRDRPTAVHGYNTNALYNSVNLNKYCVTLNLADPRGLDIFKRLVPFADIVAENFSPRVMGNFGLDYQSLTRIKPDVILVSLSAYGATGPYANIPGIGGTIEPMSGMSSLLGYEDGPPMNSGQMYPDPVAGYYGAAAALLALRHRDRTGRGQYVDLSMQEANMTFIGDALLEFALAGRVRPRMGNRHAQLAPHNVYPCREGQWIAVSAHDDDEWRRLCGVAGRPDWAADPRFATNAARKQNEAALDAEIAAWTGAADAPDLERALLAAKVTAGRVLGPAEVRRDEHLRQRGFIVSLEHPETGRLDYVGVPVRFSRTPGAATLPAPRLGEHSFQVFSKLLGMTREEYDALEADGVTGAGPPPGVEADA